MVLGIVVTLAVAAITGNPTKTSLREGGCFFFFHPAICSFHLDIKPSIVPASSLSEKGEPFVRPVVGENTHFELRRVGCR